MWLSGLSLGVCTSFVLQSPAICQPHSQPRCPEASATALCSPKDKEIIAFFGLGCTFMVSTIARTGLKVFFDISEALTAHLGFRPFTFPSDMLFPLVLR